MKDNWIFCNESLPEKSGKVLVYDKAGTMFIVNYSEKHKQFNNYDAFEKTPESEYLYEDVIAWMPLPEPPVLKYSITSPIAMHTMFSVNKPNNNINHPSHYTIGKYECIDEMIAMFGIGDVKAFCRCNVYKYRYRAKLKNGDEDLKKAEWYISKLIELEDRHD